MTEDAVRAGAILCALGGLVTAVVGWALITESNIAPFPNLQGVGEAAVLAGILLLALGVTLGVAPHQHTAVGVVIISISALTLFGGGLFIPGAVLCIVGALLGILNQEWEGELGEMLETGRSAAQRSAALAGSREPPSDCPACGNPVAPFTQACPHCGTPLIPGHSGLRDLSKCPECGEPVGARATVCPHCGTPLGSHTL